MVKPNHDRLSVTRQCELLGIARSSYYYEAKPPSKRDLIETRLIDEKYTRHPFYGSRRLADWLCEQGYPACRDRVRRFMRQLGLQAIYPKKRLSPENKEHMKYPYLLRGLTISRPEHVWCSDITYIRLRGGFVYLTAAACRGDKGVRLVVLYNFFKRRSFPYWFRSCRWTGLAGLF